MIPVGPGNKKWSCEFFCFVFFNLPADHWLVWWQRCSVPICVLIRGIKYFPLWRSIKWLHELLPVTPFFLVRPLQNTCAMQTSNSQYAEVRSSEIFANHLRLYSWEWELGQHGEREKNESKKLSVSLTLLVLSTIYSNRSMWERFCVCSCSKSTR